MKLEQWWPGFGEPALGFTSPLASYSLRKLSVLLLPVFNTQPGVSRGVFCLVPVEP
jgi:hypothetical protein